MTTTTPAPAPPEAPDTRSTGPNGPTVPAVLAPGREAEALELVAEYLAEKADGPHYTGAAFETVGNGWDAPGSAYAITPADLVAVTLLSAEVPPRAALDILQRHTAQISTQLSRIDPAATLVDAEDRLLLDRGSPGNMLWFLLRARRGRGGLAPATATKLLARKRPNLFPVHEPVAGEDLAWRVTRGHWRELRTLLQADDRALWNRLRAIQEQASPDGAITPLRIFDIVTWMAARHPEPRVPSPRRNSR